MFNQEVFTNRCLRASKYIIKLLAVSQIVKWFSPPHRALCVVGGLGRTKKESALGTIGRGKKEERPLPYNYSFPYNVVYLKCVTYFISKLIARIWVKSYLQVVSIINIVYFKRMIKFMSKSEFLNSPHP